MTANAKKTFGTKLFIIPDGGTIGDGLLAGLIMTDKPGVDHGFEDATSHDSPSGAAQRVMHGTYEVTAFNFEGEYVANSPLDQAMMTASTGGALQDCEIHEHGATGYVRTPLSGFITNYLPGPALVKGKQTFTATFTPTGALGTKQAVS